MTDVGEKININVSFQESIVFGVLGKGKLKATKGNLLLKANRKPFVKHFIGKRRNLKETVRFLYLGSHPLRHALINLGKDTVLSNPIYTLDLTDQLNPWSSVEQSVAQLSLDV